MLVNGTYISTNLKRVSLSREETHANPIFFRKIQYTFQSDMLSSGFMNGFVNMPTRKRS
jgi:hypothetical protein